MFERIEEYQLNIMLALCAVCAAMAVMLVITQFLSKRRKWIMVMMELCATFLLGFDRTAYIYKGDTSREGYIMVRASNFMVFFLTSAIVLVFNLYLMDLLLTEAKLEKVPDRLKTVSIGAVTGMLLVILSQFTGMYYTFDEENNYQRGPGFLICYIVPVVFPIVQFTVIHKYREKFRRLIYISLVLYIFVPIAVGIIQIFAYGLSIVNMAMVLVSVSLYVFTYLDINEQVKSTHEREVGYLQKEQQSMRRMFDQTVTAFVTAIDKRAPFSEGHSIRVAEIARRIADAAGKNEEECDEVYYAALLHDVGTMGIPDSVIRKTEGFTDDELMQKHQKPVLGAEILSSITEYPYISQAIRHSHEKYDGTGYPDGLKGQEIPEISRIIAVANAYETMTSRNRYHSPQPYQVVREELIKQSGTRFDPVFSDIMVQIMDDDRLHQKQNIVIQTESELTCGEYRDAFSTGIPVVKEQTKICFKFKTMDPTTFSAPTVILFSSYDRRIHNEAKTVEAYNYLEYGELWFDGHYVSTNARKIEVVVARNDDDGGTPEGETSDYEIIAGRYEDHISIRLISRACTVDMIIAIPDISRETYIGITGENCCIRITSVRKTGVQTEPVNLRRIVGKITYIDRLESDLPNVQVDHARSAYTEATAVKSELDIDFHTMSLPSANLVWHCPYILLFYSDDKTVGGKGYREFALIKINGEVSGNSKSADNRLTMKKSTAFPGWDDWKTKNKAGMECSVRIVRKGSRIIVSTENLGISIENTTVVRERVDNIYAALTGNRVALTDIRLRSE